MADNVPSVTTISVAKPSARSTSTAGASEIISRYDIKNRGAAKGSSIFLLVGLLL